MYLRIRVRWVVRAYRPSVRMFRNNCDITRITIFHPRDMEVRDETDYAARVLYIVRDPRPNRDYNSGPSRSKRNILRRRKYRDGRSGKHPSSIRTGTENTHPRNVSSPYPRLHSASRYFPCVRRRTRREDRAAAILPGGDSREILSFRDYR